jgi:hypothetical protein
VIILTEQAYEPLSTNNKDTYSSHNGNFDALMMGQSTYLTKISEYVLVLSVYCDLHF